MSRTETIPAAGIFPFALVFNAAEYTAGGYGTGFDNVWRPDWPLELPPDLFTVQHGRISGVDIEGAGVHLILRYDTEGRLEEFPLVLNGKMAQVSLDYKESSEIKEMLLSFQSGEDPWKFEFLEYGDSYPAMVRASCGDVWYFISLSLRGNVIMETWYDEEGRALGAYAFSLIRIGEHERINAVRDYTNPDGFTEFFFDSRSFLTESSGPLGVYKVLYYKEDLPRYWERRPAGGNSGQGNESGGAGKFFFQWDEGGFLVRIAGEGDDEQNSSNVPPNSDSSAVVAEYRYEYTLDTKGNWVERREVRMIRRFGLLVPTEGTTFRRVLEYSESE